jgi:hypothetical protein
VSRKLPLVSFLAGGLLLLALGVAGGVYWASQHVPHFYEEALSQEPAQQQAANDQLLENATALAASARREGHWSALFTADQINAWLAIDLPQNFPGLLPAEVVAPRVRLSPGKATIACRYEEGSISTVVSLNVELYVHEPNVLALRIHNVRAGAIPIPLSQVLEGVTRAAEEMNLRLRWLKAEGDPVALVTLPSTMGKDGIYYRLEVLDLRDGVMYVAGHTHRAGEEAPGDPPAVRQASVTQNDQR